MATRRCHAILALPCRGGSVATLPRLWLALAAACLFALPPAPAPAADTPEVTTFELSLDDEGVTLSYSVDFELTRSVEEALNKGVPLYFLAEAEVYQSRWYWRDKRVAHATRLWRVVYQPLTSSYRVTFGRLPRPVRSRPAGATMWNSACAWTPRCCRARCRSASAASPTGL
jgi:hypothetical protein